MVVLRLPGGIPIYLFSIMLAVGVIVGIGTILVRQGPTAARQRMDAALWALAGALIGGRAAFVILSWSYFRQNLAEIFQVHLGGLAWSGALGGSLVFLAAYALLTRQALAGLADDLTPLLLTLGIVGQLGCLVDGCGYGAPVAWGGVASADEWGTVIRRQPVQIVGALLYLGLFWLTDHLPPKWDRLTGLRACLALLGLVAIQLGAVIVTAPHQTLRRLPVDAWAALVFAGLALVGFGLIVGRRQAQD